MGIPARPQPFDPPVEAATVWAIPREGIPDLAAILYAQIMWGKEPHPSQVRESEYAGWESVRPRWEAATAALLDVLEASGHIAFSPAPQQEEGK